MKPKLRFGVAGCLLGNKDVILLMDKILHQLIW